VPSSHVYVHVNNDEADRILVDPAYKLEKIKKAHESLYAMTQAFETVQAQLHDQELKMKIPFSKDLYENWVNIEKSIHRFDRVFNRVERFNARAMTDPDNHDRREKRMITRRNERWAQNYTFFFGDMTEEEQQYRDYFESDPEVQAEDNDADEKHTDDLLAMSGQFNPALYDFQDLAHEWDLHEDYSDIVEQKIFKFKYRKFADSLNNHQRRQLRVESRFHERAKNRDPALEQNLNNLFLQNEKQFSYAQYMVDAKNFNNTAETETRPFREYMVKEAVQQYKDYYESDADEQEFFQYLDNYSNRDKIRMMELFTDYSAGGSIPKAHFMIPKREYNPQLSAISNMMLDLVDFKDRVRPLSNDIARIEQAVQHQKMSTSMRKEQVSEALKEQGKNVRPEEIDFARMKPAEVFATTEQKADSRKRIH